MANKHSVTWAQAFRDTVIASMNRGQLPVLGGMFIFALIIWKMPEQDVSKLAFMILENIKKFQLIAYPLLIIVTLLYFYHVRFMRKDFSRELERIGKEKSALQSSLSGNKFKSSNRK